MCVKIHQRAAQRLFLFEKKIFPHDPLAIRVKTCRFSSRSFLSFLLDGIEFFPESFFFPASFTLLSSWNVTFSRESEHRETMKRLWFSYSCESWWTNSSGAKVEVFQCKPLKCLCVEQQQRCGVDGKSFMSQLKVVYCRLTVCVCVCVDP